jgi:hypothetical protein
MLTWKKTAFVAFSAIGLAVGVPASSNAANLIQNGGFENTTPVIGSSTSGQLDNYVIADHWTSAGPGSGTSNPPSSSDTGSFNVLFNSAAQATTTGVQDQAGNMTLWAATDSPNGGNFVGGDGDVRPGSLHVGPISQEVDGLNVGGKYQLGFFWAAAQEKPFDGTTKQSWLVTVTPVGGGSADATVSTPTFTLPQHTFSGWMKFTFDFVTTSANEVISFTPVGDKPVPPVTLLDGVTLTAVPEPSNILASVLVFGMFGAVWAFKRAKQPAVVA